MKKPSLCGLDNTQLINVLARHQGAEKGISAARLALQLGVTTRRLRLLVTQAREDGIAVCGRPSTGYFMPTTPAELNSTCEFLESRAMRSLYSLSRMRKVALPVLMGQMLLAKG